jgi:hypothetical protein
MRTSLALLCCNTPSAEPEQDDDSESGDEARKRRDTPDAGEEIPFETMESSAEFDRALYDGGEFGGGAPGSPEEEDFLGLPGLLEPEQVSVLLRKRKAEQAAARRAGHGETEDEDREQDRATHEQLAELRKELNNLVGAWHHRTGRPHGNIHTDLRKACGGPPVAQATVEQLRERITTLRHWATGRSG